MSSSTSDITSGPRATRALHVQEGAYRADKLLWHGDRIGRMRRGLPIAPVTVHFVISDLCNHACNFCSFRMEDNLQNELFGIDSTEGRNNNPARWIPKNKCLELLEDFADLGVRGVEFTGGGEPSIHPDAAEIFARCRSLGLEASLVTNGQKLPEALDATLTEFSWIRFSIDAATPATWSQCRNVTPHGFLRVLDNARRLIAARERARSQTTIGAGFVLYAENWHEAYDAVALYKDAGFDSVRLGAIFNSSQKAAHFDGFLEPARELCARAKQDFEDENFRVANNFDARLEDLGQDGRPDYERCRYQELVAYVGGDQQLYRCCDTAYNPIGHLADLSTQRFRDAWLALYESGAFSRFDAGASCEFCMFNNRNRIAAEAIDGRLPVPPGGPAPEHLDFV